MKKSYTLMVLWSMLASLNATCLPQLSSLPTATATIFLDFDGQHVQSSVWNAGNPLDCASSGLTDAQIIQVFNRVAEDYRPFNVNITTDSTKFLAAPLTSRIRMIITTTSSWYPNVGGVAYTGSFTWGDDTPGFIFSDKLGPFNTKNVAEACTHESGHTLGLSHQSKYSNTCTLIAAYNDGIGSGEIGWAPIMGVGYYKNQTTWNNGPTPSGCTAVQDNLSIITDGSNGFTYRSDDHSDNPAINPTVISIANQSFSTSGIISTTTDKDVFKITFTQHGILHVNASPYSVGANNDGANLDIQLKLLNASFQVIGTYNPASTLNAVIDTTLNTGTYYFLLDGTGNANTSNYGSLGSYTISGTFNPTSVTPIRSIVLTGRVDKNKHDLDWNIVADEQIKAIELQSSADGINFNPVTTVTPTARTFVYDPFSSANIFYRLKVTSVIYQTAFSNVIVLKSSSGNKKMTVVSTYVHDEIMINAGDNFQYRITDISGRVMVKGNNNAGINKINIANAPNGIYIIQIVSNNERLTERIIKQ